MRAADIIERFNAEPDERGRGYRAACPVHEMEGAHAPSLILNFNRDTRKALVLCESQGCDLADILVAVRLSKRDLSDVSYIGQSVRHMTGAAHKAPASEEARRTAAGEAYKHAVSLAAHLRDEPGSAVAGLLSDKYGLDPETITSDEADRLGVGLDENGWLSIVSRTTRGAVAFMQARNPDASASRRWDSLPNPEGGRWDAAGFVGPRHPEGTAVVVEGMSDGLVVGALDTFDTVAVRGARLGARISEVADALAGRDVVLVIDADDAGRALTETLLSSLATVTASTRVAVLDEGTDVGDLRATDPETFAERFAALLEAAESREATVEFDVQPYLKGRDLDRGRALVEYARARGFELAWTASHDWLVFDGRVWVERAGSRVRQLAHALGDHVGQMVADLEDELTALGPQSRDDEQAAAQRARITHRLKAVRGFVYMCGTSTKIDAMLRETRSLAGVVADQAEFDANPDLLGVGNGVVDLRTGRLRPMRAADKITRRLAVDYRPEAKAPRWERFLSEVLVADDGTPAADVVEYMHGLIGYGLTGHTSEQMFVLLNGRGSNGKSVLTGVLSDVFGDVTTATPFSTFEQKAGGGGIPNDLAALKGARFVIAQESNLGARMSEATLKAVTGQDTISARFMRAEFFEFRPAFLLMLVTNHLPKFLGQDDGLWRRVRLIEFRRKFARHEQDRALASDLLDEAEGILAWAVEGARRWYAAGKRLPSSATIDEASDGYRRDSDVLGEFLAEAVVETGNPRHAVFHKDLLAWYHAYADEAGMASKDTLSASAFSNALYERLGRPPRGRKAYPKHCLGYRMRNPAEIARWRLQQRRAIERGLEAVDVTVSDDDPDLAAVREAMPDLPEPAQQQRYAGPGAGYGLEAPSAPSLDAIV